MDWAGLATFEVLCDRFALAESGLAPLAELIHDIGLKDGKFGRPETAGLALLHGGHEARLLRGAELFDERLSYFAKKGD